MSRTSLYWTVNACFWLVLVLGIAVDSENSAHPLYLALLFSLCTTPIFNLQRLNDRYALLAIFSVVYFQFYGVVDLISLFTIGEPLVDTGFLSITEIVILIGCGLSQVFYRVACRNNYSASVPENAATTNRDWPEKTLVIVGCVLWCVATVFTWKLKVNVLTETTAEGTARGLAALGPLETIGLLLANMLQPLGILILAYAQSRYQRAYLMPLVIGVVLVQLVLGFVIDVKGEALIGAVLVIVTQLMVNGKLPKSWLIASIAFVIAAFPALQANRMIRNQNNLNHADVSQNLVKVAKEAFSKSEQVSTGENRSQTIFERSSLKGSVEMIVTRTGNDVAYQYGYTLTPIYAAFIPKIVWPKKPDVQTGQLVNKAFGVVTEYAYVYISPSHLGELYWNFGWLGVLFGMALFGLFLGYIGKRVDMSTNASITRLMVAAITVRLLILGFESSIAAPYVVWMRSMAAIGILHFALAKAQTSNAISYATTSTLRRTPKEPPTALFPNLMR